MTDTVLALVVSALDLKPYDLLGLVEGAAC